MTTRESGPRNPILDWRTGRVMPDEQVTARVSGGDLLDFDAPGLFGRECDPLRTVVADDYGDGWVMTRQLRGVKVTACDGRSYVLAGSWVGYLPGFAAAYTETRHGYRLTVIRLRTGHRATYALRGFRTSPSVRFTRDRVFVAEVRRAVVGERYVHLRWAPAPR